MTSDGAVRTAIILAAGAGTRMGQTLTRGLPKCLLPVGGQPILQHQVQALRHAGITDIVLVIGHRERAVREAAQAIGARHGVRFRFVHNPRHAHTNTLYSQYLARHELAAPCLCLNGDVLFPPWLLPRLCRAEGDAVLAVDVRLCGEEEVKVLLDDAQRIRRIGKKLDPARCLGEFIGVARYRGPAGPAFAEALDAAVRAGGADHDYFERALDDLAPRLPLRVLALRGAPVIEIDFPQDLVRAEAEVLPRLRDLDPAYLTEETLP